MSGTRKDRLEATRGLPVASSLSQAPPGAMYRFSTHFGLIEKIQNYIKEIGGGRKLKNAKTVGRVVWSRVFSSIWSDPEITGFIAPELP